MRIIKPKKLGTIYRTYGRDKGNHLTVSPLLFFSLAPSGGLIEETVAWPKLVKSLPRDAVLDAGFPKPGAEVLLAGTAYNPTGDNPTLIRMNIGVVDKSLQVWGDRQWTKQGGRYDLSDPAPFEQMPIGYDRAYGGAAFPANPAGRGYDSQQSGQPQATPIPAPNFVYPDEDVEPFMDNARPASFLPVDIAVRLGSGLSGTYDDVWLNEYYPGFPLDLDDRFFNEAPQDQRLTEHFSGGEPYRLEGLSAQVRCLAGELPSFRTRVFVKRKKHDGDGLEEIPSVIDTAWFFPDENIGVLIYRATTAVEDSDALDIDDVMLAFERTEDEARSRQDYLATYRLRTDPETAMANVFNESQLSPLKTPEQIAIEQQELQRAQEKEIRANQKAIDAVWAEIQKKSGGELPEGFEVPKAQAGPIPVIPLESIARGDVDLSGFMQAVKKTVAEHRENAEMRLKEIDKKLEQIPKAETTVQPPDCDAVDPEQQFKERVQRDKPADLDEETAGKLDALESLLSSPAPEKSSGLAQARSSLAETRKLMREARRQSPQDLSKAVKLSDSDSDRVRRVLLNRVDSASPVAGADIAGTKLSGLVVRDYDLSEIMFESCEFTDCEFRNCDLTGSVFTGAKLNNARFITCNLSECNLSNVTVVDSAFNDCELAKLRLIGADFKRSGFTLSNISDGQWLECSFQSCDFSNCRIENISAAKSDFLECRFVSGNFRKMLCIGCSVGSSIFDESVLLRCAFIKTSVDGCSFASCRMNTIQFGGMSSASNMSWHDCTAETVGLRGLALSNSSFNASVFRNTDFGGSSFLDCDLGDAGFCQCCFIGAKFVECELVNTEFYRSKMIKSVWQRSNLDSSSYFESSTAQMLISECSLNEVRSLDTRQVTIT